MQKIIVTGSNGLIGSNFVRTYQDKYEIIPFDLSGTPSVDITNEENLRQKLTENRDALAVVHLAAFTNVSAAHEQQGDKNGPAYQVNVVGTRNLARACADLDLYLVHISTAYVFNGDKPSLYFEDDVPSPIEWYGETKALAEKEVLASGARSVILRIDQPFSAEKFAKVDTVHRIIDGLNNQSLYPQFANHYFGPTYIEDFSKVIEFFIRTQKTGLFHATSGEKWSDYDFAVAIQALLDLPGKVKKGDLDEYLKTLKRPYQRNTAMNNDKLKEVLDFQLKTIQQALTEVKV
ncbi:MAG: NAD(P)-dependent oxidoreductase [bacterium]|nr:NAD(P)-dependent oxidoreductase [bacterium]